jgi:hypothetical protein
MLRLRLEPAFKYTFGRFLGSASHTKLRQPALVLAAHYQSPHGQDRLVESGHPCADRHLILLFRLGALENRRSGLSMKML